MGAIHAHALVGVERVIGPQQSRLELLRLSRLGRARDRHQGGHDSRSGRHDQDDTSDADHDTNPLSD